jgi:hypothetical protein
MKVAASLAQSVERQTLNLLVVGSSPTGGVSLTLSCRDYSRRQGMLGSI